MVGVSTLWETLKFFLNLSAVISYISKLVEKSGKFYRSFQFRICRYLVFGVLENLKFTNLVKFSEEAVGFFFFFLFKAFCISPYWCLYLLESVILKNDQLALFSKIQSTYTQFKKIISLFAVDVTRYSLYFALRNGFDENWGEISVVDLRKIPFIF